MVYSRLVRVLRALRVRTAGGMLLLCAAALAPPALWAQGTLSGDPDELRVYAYTLQHQSVNEALALVRPLLSNRAR